MTLRWTQCVVKIWQCLLLKTPFLPETVLLLFRFGPWVRAAGEYGGSGRRCENELRANYRRVRQQMLPNRSVWQLLGVHSKSEHLSYEKGGRVQPKSPQVRWEVHQRFAFKFTNHPDLGVERNRKANTPAISLNYSKMTGSLLFHWSRPLF